MRYVLVLLLVAAGCSESNELSTLKSALRDSSSQVIASTTETTLIVKEQTETLKENTQSLRDLAEKIDTLKAAQAVPEAKQVEEVIQSADDTEPGNKANDAQPTTTIVAKPGSVRLVPAKVKMAWNIDGNWNPSFQETSRHLRESHGMNVDGLSHQQLHDLHRDLHEGRVKANAVKSKSVQVMSGGSSCPGGVCPTNSRQSRRGLFGRRR